MLALRASRRSSLALRALPRAFSAVPSTSFTLPDLTYDYGALEPVRPA